MRRNIMTQPFGIGLYILLGCIVGCSRDDSDRDTSAKKQAEPPVTIQAESNYCFLVAERDQISQISLTGEKEKFEDFASKIECCGETVYLSRQGNLTALDLQGNQVSEIKRADEIESQINFTAIPQGGFAFLDNRNDKVYFTDAQGHYAKAIAIKDSVDKHAQNMHGIVVGNRLIVSEDGDRQIVSIDLTTYQKTIFRSLPQLRSWLGAIAYHQGIYHICNPQEIYSFTEDSQDITRIAKVPKKNITGIEVVDGKAYVIVNGPNKIEEENGKRILVPTGALYEVDLKTGNVRVIKDELFKPNDLAIIPKT